jgi:hypothetical protein
MASDIKHGINNEISSQCGYPATTRQSAGRFAMSPVDTKNGHWRAQSREVRRFIARFASMAPTAHRALSGDRLYALHKETDFQYAQAWHLTRWRVIATNLARFPNCELDYGQRLSARISLSILVRVTAARREAGSPCAFRDSSGNFSTRVAFGGDAPLSAPPMPAAIQEIVSAS